MQNVLAALRLAAALWVCFPSLSANAQGYWAAYSHKIDVKKYQGHNFRLQASVRSEVTDDSASARLYARVDKEGGYMFFNNMEKQPIRSKEWKLYVIEGKIDTGATDLSFGPLCMYNGRFFFDNFKVEIQLADEKWEKVFSANFEDGKNNFGKGIGGTSLSFNPYFKVQIVKELKPTESRHLLIESKGVPIYGMNARAGKYAEVNGIKLYYEVYGQGPPLVVLHGNGGSIVDAADFYPDLIKKYKVIAVDSRSQGRSTDTDAPLTYDQMASDVNALLENLNIDSVFVWGQSDGAILGLLLAMNYPVKVKKVVAFGSNIQPDSLAVFQWTIDAVNKTLKQSADNREKKLNRLMLDYPKIPYSDLKKINAPVLVVAGDRDMIRPEHTLKIFQHIPNSQMCILPGATHGAAWEQKELFLKMMENFFDKPFTMPDTKSWFN